MRKKIFSSFSIRKRLPIRIFGSTVYETIRIPVNPMLAIVVMIAEYMLGKPSDSKGNDKQIDGE